MYMPPFFEETDPAVLQALISEFPLGAIVTRTPDGLTADHIPFLFMAATGETGDRLIGHVARNNNLWRDPDPTLEPMVIFQGISAYITPTWYQTKAETHMVVPTYNYAVVHVHGPLIIHDDPKWVRMIVGRLTQRFESEQVDCLEDGRCAAGLPRRPDRQDCRNRDPNPQNRGQVESQPEPRRCRSHWCGGRPG